MYVNILTTAAPKARVISLRRPTEINSIEIPSNLDNHVIQPRNIAVKKKIVDGLIGLCSIPRGRYLQVIMICTNH